MAPRTIDMQSTGGSYLALALAIKDILTVVHTQFYNAGAMLGCDQNAAYTQGRSTSSSRSPASSWRTGCGRARPRSVCRPVPVLGPRAAAWCRRRGQRGAGLPGPRGTKCGSFKPPRTYPSIRGAMTWSVNWDVTNGNRFASTVGPHLDALP